MRGNVRILRSICVLSLVTILIFLAASSAFYNAPVSALIKYGYKKGDQYRFVAEASSTSDTEVGKTTSSGSGEYIAEVTDIDEDTGGYKLRIELLTVTMGSAYSPMMEGTTLISEPVIEGNKLMSSGHISMLFNLFTSTDWDERQTEWDTYVESIDNEQGYRVTEENAASGVFTLRAEMDVSSSDHLAFDYDGDKEGYTGWLTVRGEYDSNGVLKSEAMETYMKFNDRNSLTSSYKLYSGSRSLISTEPMLLISGGIVAVVVAFFLGFLLSRRRSAPMATSTPSQARRGNRDKRGITLSRFQKEDSLDARSECRVVAYM